MQEDELITLAKAARTIGLSHSLLRREARLGKLKAMLTESDLGVPVYKTTMRDVLEWRGKVKMGRPRKHP